MSGFLRLIFYMIDLKGKVVPVQAVGTLKVVRG
jgi:hypothetical protein